MPVIAAVSLGLLALLLGTGLGIAAKKFAVQPDEREERALEVLPGANCGACGFPGCQAFASALAEGKCGVTGCPVGGNEIHSRLAEIMGIKYEETGPRTVVVRCSGRNEVAPEKSEYKGIENCLAAGLVANGPKACEYGCLGFGDCVKACPFGALKMGKEGLPEVDSEACTACGICVEDCPRNIIQLIPASQAVYVGCVSPERGKDVRQVCKAGCTGCGICAKVSPEGAIEMDGNLPVIKSEKAEDLEKAAEKCPTKVLLKRK